MGFISNSASYIGTMALLLSNSTYTFSVFRVNDFQVWVGVKFIGNDNLKHLYERCGLDSPDTNQKWNGFIFNTILIESTTVWLQTKAALYKICEFGIF